ncbi:MAG: L,D-transpeptidase family protein [Magnetococcales bacterium]|nr:L,D-transpeptidase family protein [Magnetococcales bacterium]
MFRYRRGVSRVVVVASLLFGVLANGSMARSDELRPEDAPSLAMDKKAEEPVVYFDQEIVDRVRTLLSQAGLEYPLRKAFSLLIFKEERLMELWVEDDTGPRLIKSYPILGMSGHAGPKRRRGDLQVPEGIYQITLLNAHSSYHLSLKLDYPNLFDLQKATEEGRTDLGGDIYIHGGSSSVGCIAMGNPAVEELYVLTLTAGTGPREVIIAPYDFRQQPDKGTPGADPVWLPELYQEMTGRLGRYSVSAAEH